MSLIPLDEPRGDGRSTTRDERDDRSLLQRFWAGMKATVLALPGARALVDRPTATAESASSNAVPATREPDRPTDRKAPATIDNGPDEDEGPELVSTEEGDTLTVEVVDNPDATISSDTWEPVER